MLFSIFFSTELELKHMPDIGNLESCRSNFCRQGLWRPSIEQTSLGSARLDIGD